MNETSGGDDLWEAMADPTRRKLLDLLVAHAHATPTTLASEMPVSRQAISKHLTVLQRVGLIDGHRHGREVRYEVRHNRLAEATEALSEVASRWDRRLRAIKQLAEDAHLGADIGAFTVPEDFDAPLPANVIADFER